MSRHVGKCWLCLCEICTRFQCPLMKRRYSLTFCTNMIMSERCPIPKCDYFEHKVKHKRYKIVRIDKKRDQLIDRIETLQESIDRLNEKL